MKKFGFVILALAVSVYLFGCGKKQQTLEEMQEPMSIESLSTTGTQLQATAPEVKTPEAKSQVVAPVPTGAEPKLETMPPSGPYKPGTEAIQKALKNAGFYAGSVDGKKGPKTKKAIEDFQKANGLQADGKVGSKTWSALSKHLNMVPQATETTKAR
jgi:peptidoglycan hydrolase-like protein with peptidoglycan-binding domain